MLKGLECTISAKVNKGCSGNRDGKGRGNKGKGGSKEGGGKGGDLDKSLWRGMGEERNRQEERETDARGMKQRRRNGDGKEECLWEGRMVMGRRNCDGKEEWRWEGGMVMRRRNGDGKEEF